MIILIVFTGLRRCSRGGKATEIREYGIRFLEMCGGVLLSRRPSGNGIAIVISFRDGVAFESEREWGMSHFLEHVNMQGTPEYPSLAALSAVVEREGGQFSALSTRDATTYWIKVPRWGLGPALHVLSDVLSNLEFEQSSFEAEKSVVIQELARERANYRLFSGLSLEHELLPPPISRYSPGDPDAIRSFTAEEVRAYKAKVYGRRNCYVAMTGAFREKQAEKELNRALSALPEGERRVYFEPSLPLREGPSVRIEYGSLSMINLIVGWPLKGSLWKQWAALNLLNTLLGVGFGALFYKILREEERLTYLVTTQLKLYLQGGTFRASLEVRPENAGRALALIHRVVDSVQYLDDATIDRARARFCGNMVLKMDDVMEYAFHLNRRLITGSEPRSVRDIIDMIMTVHKDELALICHSLLCPGEARVGMAGSREGLLAAEKTLKEVHCNEVYGI